MADTPDGIDKELADYRDLMKPPGTFEDGFNIRTIIGIFFVAAVMMPSTIYLQLTVGQTLGSAAVWVTVILFSEIARRSRKPLKRVEIYMLVYVAGHMAVGGPFFHYLYLQYFAQSAIAQSHGIILPNWVCPSPDSAALLKRTFWHADWIPAITLVVVGGVLARLSWVSVGYFLFRITSDVERLPFPMAPIAAAGATALAESGKETWRWRVFSIGSMMGAAFGAVYVLVPAATQAFVGKPLFLIPIPWIDLTTRTEAYLPAAATGISTNIGAVIWGMVLPFWMIVGSAIAAMVHMLINPILHSMGYLKNWRPGMGTIETEFVNNIDFWFSFILGTTFAVALIGFYGVIRALTKRKKQGERGRLDEIPKGRGDFSMWLAVAIFICCQLAYVGLCLYLIEGLGKVVVAFLFFFALVYTPLVSYINARMDGLTGLNVNFPFIREATFILSGYRGVDIWFAPFPIHQYGQTAQRFREFELTGTKFTSMFKAEAFMFPVVLVFSFLFCAYIWGSGEPIPSSSYQWAQKMWNRQALQQCIIFSSTISRRSTTNACAFMPGGGVLTADSDGARVWAEDGSSRLLSVGTEGATAVAASPDGALIATAEPGGAVYVWRAEDVSQPAFSFKGHEGSVHALEFSPDGALLASGSDDRTVRIWPLDESARGPRVLKARVGKITAVSWSAAGIAAAGLEGPVELWDAGRGERLRNIGGPALDVRFSADGALVFTAGPDGSLASYQTATGREAGGAPAPEKFDVLTASVGPDGRTVACLAEGGELIIIRDGEVVFHQPVFRRGATAVSADEAGVLVGTNEGPITLRDFEGKVERTLLTPETRAESLFFKAWKPGLLFTGLGFGIVTYALLSVFSLPTLLLYGFVGGLASLPHDTIPLLIGALLGRFIFRRKFGLNWKQYTPVLAAGFACGMGLVGMAGIALSLLRTAVITKPW